ncbi:MAG: hypothetical protein ACFB10_03000 [Salibacteraceae bacterium]
MNRYIIYLLTSLLLLTGGPLMAQEDEGWKRTSQTPEGEKDPYQMKTLLGNRKIRHGVYLAYHMMGTRFDSEDGLLIGGRVAWIINHRLAIGGAGYGLANNLNLQSQEFNARLYDFNFGYGGLLVEPIVGSSKPIHVSFPTLLGAGGANFENSLLFYDRDAESWTDLSRESDSFFVLEPGVELELNLLRYFRLSTGISYRYLMGLDLGDVDDDKLDGLSIGLALKFGFF